MVADELPERALRRLWFGKKRNKTEGDCLGPIIPQNLFILF